MKTQLGFSLYGWFIYILEGSALEICSFTSCFCPNKWFLQIFWKVFFGITVLGPFEYAFFLLIPRSEFFRSFEFGRCTTNRDRRLLLQLCKAVKKRRDYLTHPRKIIELFFWFKIPIRFFFR